jgi:hypothetical protein
MRLKPTTRLACVLIVGSLVLVAGASPRAGGAGTALPAPKATESIALAGLSLDFVENQGQWDGASRFVARQGPVAASIEPGAVRLTMAGEHPTDVRLTFDGAATGATLAGEQLRDGRYNFFVGNDSRKWRSNVRAFGAVRYRGLYDGVDLRVLQRDGRIAYDLLLAPGADLRQVVIRTDGASAIKVDADGTLVLDTAAGPLRQTAPATWEELPDGTTHRLDSRFRTIDATHYGFEVPGRDTTRPLVIDPGLEWSTFVGGSNREEIHGLALTRDGTGDVVVAGSTWSSDFPTAPAGSLGSSPLIPFVARVNATGTALVYATLFGGTNGNVSFGLGLTLDASSAPIVVGETNAANFPTTPGAYQPTFNEPSAAINRGWDGFVTRFNASGSQMVFSTFLGAAPIFDESRPGAQRGGHDSARVVVTDASDNVIVAGLTTSENFPTTAGAYDRTHSTLTVQVDIGTIESRSDAFISRLTPNGSQLTYSTYLGGQSDDVVKDMVIDAQGVLTLVGIEAPLETFDGQGNRTDHGIPFPTTPDAVTRTHLGASDTFLARLRLDGTGTGDLKYATILGAFYIDEATGVALDPNNPELVTLSGYSRSWDFPTTAGAWKRAPLFLADSVPYYSGFLVRFRFPASGGGSLVWSTLVGGTTFTGQFADSVLIDGSGDVIVVGSDIAGSFPTTDRSYKRLPAKGDFLARFSGDGRNLLYSTLLHNPSGVLVVRKKIVSSGPHAVVVAGSTLFTDFPTTPGAFDRVFGSNGTSDGFHTYDGYVAKVTLDPNTSTDTTAAAPALLAPANGATIPLNGALTFDWTDVADSSGVQFYQVDISANADFVPGFYFWNLGMGSFTASQSTGSSSQEGVHYWRVRTLDGANNFSPWSEVRKFTVGAPTWTNFAASGLTPNAVVGGNTVQGVVHILNTAPAGGQLYTLSSSNPSVASVPSSVRVPAGGSSAMFTVTTHSVSVSTPVMFTVWSEGNGEHPILWVDPGTPPPPGPVTLSSLAISPTSVTGGTPSSATVTLSGAAPAGGAVVALSSSGSAASVPANVTVPAGATTASFSITTSSVTSSTPVTITASFGGVSRGATLTVTAAVGGGVPGFLSPASNAPDTGGDGNGFQSTPVNAHTDDAAVATDTNSGTGTSTSCTNSGKDRHRFYDFGFAIPGGSAIAGIEVRLDARADSTSGAPRMCVQLSSDGGATWTAAKATGTLATSLASFTLGGASDTWGRAWSAANLSNASFRLRVINVASSTSRDFFLEWVGVRPHTVVSGPAALNAVSVSPTSVTGGNPATGTVTLTAAAPSSGAVVSLSTSPVAVASVPASVTVAAGATSATFPITTSAVGANTSVTITAAYDGTTRTAALTVTPPPPAASLGSVTVSPTSVTGGTSAQGTVTLTAAAPAGGFAVTLSDNSSAATVPASVTVAQGATSASFAIATTSVTASAPVTITATAAGVTRTTTLTVTAAGQAMTLTVTATGRSGERITSSPTGINVAVGSSGSASFTSGTSITLSVSNGRDAIWSGACSSGGNKTRTCTFTLNAAGSVTANVQ